MEKIALFSYIHGRSFIHRMSGTVKLFFLCALPPLLFFIPIKTAPFVSALFILLYVMTHLPLRHHLKDLSPILSYILLLYAVDTAAGLQTGHFLRPPEQTTVELTVRLILSIQATSIFFRTTTSASLTSSLSSVEKKITGRIQYTAVFSLFLSFIPLVFSVWTTVSRAWKARGGKKGLKQAAVLLPVLISVCMHKAHTSSLAVKNRTEY